MKKSKADMRAEADFIGFFGTQYQQHDRKRVLHKLRRRKSKLKLKRLSLWGWGNTTGKEKSHE